jgi:site-specific DNA-methyltransferase (adenine-specific)
MKFKNQTINMIEINKIHNENCLKTMSRMPDGFIDLTVTSPPYDNLREYNGYTFDFESIAKELFRVTKHGGVVVWIVGDATIKGSETGTSFKQALYFKDIGFNLHDTMIWTKPTFSAVGALQTRYAPIFEYMFILTKGRIKTFNPIKDRKNTKHGRKNNNASIRKKNGEIKYNKSHIYKKYGQRFNVWKINTEVKSNHPAPFPEKLASDHIVSWSNPDDLVYDCFTGSGTTAKMCLLNERNFIGSELSAEYCEIANKRIEETKKIIALEKTQMKLF